MRKIMSSLDVGANELKLVVGEMIKDKLNILSTCTIPIDCIKKGKITDKETMKISLKQLFSDAEKKLGFKIKKTLVTVPSESAMFVIGNAKVDIENEEQLVTSKDLVNVVRLSAKNVVQDNAELVTIIPINYTLDDGTKVIDPKKRFSKTLEVKTVIVSGLKSEIYPILECLEEISIDVIDISYDSLGDYFAFKNKNTENKVGAIVNIGACKTTVSIFNKGVLTNTALFYLGGNNIDNDISYIYNLDKGISKQLKENFSLANTKLASKNDYEEVINKDGQKLKISQYDISKSVESRLEEILNIAKKQINVLTKKEISYIIFTGGVTEMADFKLSLEEVFGKRVTLGSINILGVRDNKYSSAVGLIKWFDYNQRLKGRDYSILSLNEQTDYSEMDEEHTISNNSVIGKVFGYFFDN